MERDEGESAFARLGRRGLVSRLHDQLNELLEARDQMEELLNVIVDISDSIERQIAALIRHESQMPGFNVAAGETMGDRLKKGAAALAQGFGFRYGAVFRRLIARR